MTTTTPTRSDAAPLDARPSGSLAVFDAIAKVGELEALALGGYVCCAQAALELVATGDAPASWSGLLPGEAPRQDGDGVPLLPEPGESPGDLRVPKALTVATGVYLLHMALRQFAAITAAEDEWEALFGCSDYCADLGVGVTCGGGPHIPEHMLDTATEIEREMDRAPEYLADYADAIAWTLTHGLRDRLRAMTGPAGELRLTCHPEQADELLARVRAALPTVGEPRGPYPNRPRRHGEGQDAAAGMVRVYLDLDNAPDRRPGAARHQPQE